jgi:hypothetical protein
MKTSFSSSMASLVDMDKPAQVDMDRPARVVPEYSHRLNCGRWGHSCEVEAGKLVL